MNLGKAFLTSITAAALVSGCAGHPTKSDSAGGIPLAGTFKVHRKTFDNGLRLLVVEDHSSPTFAYETWFRVGSRDENKGHTGLAHLFEHMMFKETKNFKDGEFDKILESSGVEGENAFTSRDYTAYVQELPKDKLELIAKLESDRMVNLVVDEKVFKTETDVVQNERRYRNENSPDGTMYQELFDVAFTKHPYHWPVIGYQKDLEAMTTADAVQFYHSYYSPNHATIIIVGDVTPELAESVVQKYYGDIPGQASPVHTIEAEPEQTAPRRKTLKLNIQVEKLLMGYHIPGITQEDIPAINVLQMILTGGKSARLNRALVETGIATSVDSYDIEDKDPSVYILGSNLQKGKKATQAESIILREIARIGKELVSDKELETAKNKANFGFYEGLANSSEKAHFLGHYEAVAGDFNAGLALQKKIASVTALDVQAVTKRYFQPKNRTVIVGVTK